MGQGKDTPGLAWLALLVMDCQGRVGLWRAHRPGVLGILDQVPSIEQLILHGL